MSKLFQNEAEAEFTGLMNTTDEIVTAVADTKIKDDDIDLALDALRNCDTDFIKFDEVFIFILYMNSLIVKLRRGSGKDRQGMAVKAKGHYGSP